MGWYTIEIVSANCNIFFYIPYNIKHDIRRETLLSQLFISVWPYRGEGRRLFFTTKGSQIHFEQKYATNWTQFLAPSIAFLGLTLPMFSYSLVVSSNFNDNGNVLQHRPLSQKLMTRHHHWLSMANETVSNQYSTELNPILPIDIYSMKYKIQLQKRGYEIEPTL